MASAMSAGFCGPLADPVRQDRALTLIPGETGPDKRRRFGRMTLDQVADEAAVESTSNHSLVARVEIDRRVAAAQIEAAKAQVSAARAQIWTAWLTAGSVMLAAATLAAAYAGPAWKAIRGLLPG